MKRLSLALLILVPLWTWAKTVVYTPDTITNFCNPERGFYVDAEQRVKESGKTNLSESTFTSARSKGTTLILRLYYLNNFRNVDIPQAVLDQMNEDFELFRQYGCKAILRFAYTSNDSEFPYQDASPAIWKRHLEQLRPILYANEDVISVVQAGFLGVWGEWYYSSTKVGGYIPQQVKNDLINDLLYAVPPSRCIQLRTPAYKQAYIGDTMALTAEEGFTQTARARIGHHNDAFMYNLDNMGTYRNREQDMNYLDQECLYLPNGGETDVCSEGVYKKHATGAQAIADMAKLHYSYLNSGYCRLTLDHWKEEGAYAIMERNMGYRFELIQTIIPDKTATNQWMSFIMQVKNVGYATPYNERHVYLVLKNDANHYAIRLQCDPRRWLPNGKTTNILETVKMPSDIVPGTYQLYLHIADPAPSIADKPEFSIRLANVDMWEEATGWNDLGTSIYVGVGTDTGLRPEQMETVGVYKQFGNGRVIIVHHGVEYDVMGQQIR